MSGSQALRQGPARFAAQHLSKTWKSGQNTWMLTRFSNNSKVKKLKNKTNSPDKYK